VEWQRLMQYDLPCRQTLRLSTDHSPLFCAPEHNG
jgi:hypothetical protein